LVGVGILFDFVGGRHENGRVNEFDVGDTVDVPEYNTGVYTVVALPGCDMESKTEIVNGTLIVTPSGKAGLTLII
jgi:hypothetical protein